MLARNQPPHPAPVKYTHKHTYILISPPARAHLCLIMYLGARGASPTTQFVSRLSAAVGGCGHSHCDIGGCNFVAAVRVVVAMVVVVAWQRSRAHNTHLDGVFRYLRCVAAPDCRGSGRFLLLNYLIVNVYTYPTCVAKR